MGIRACSVQVGVIRIRVLSSYLRCFTGVETAIYALMLPAGSMSLLSWHRRGAEALETGLLSQISPLGDLGVFRTAEPPN